MQHITFMYRKKSKNSVYFAFIPKNCEILLMADKLCVKNM